ncbi:MAG: outer membrane protein assembly factor BamE [Parvibaculum sp.]|nr:outer membrane protein assembly factor BamE [Parvibaculum sp.]
MTSNRLRRRAGLLAAVAVLAISSPVISACTLVEPVKASRGYIVDEDNLKKLKPGITTLAQVGEYMGSPSTISTDDGVAWYYITVKTQTFLFFAPEEEERTVVAVYFDKTDVVQEVLYYGLQDGQVVDLVTRTTPTRGKELTILGQLFGNLGRFNKDSAPKSTTPKPGGN